MPPTPPDNRALLGARGGFVDDAAVGRDAVGDDDEVAGAAFEPRRDVEVGRDDLIAGCPPMLLLSCVRA